MNFEKIMQRSYQQTLSTVCPDGKKSKIQNTTSSHKSKHLVANSLTKSIYIHQQSDFRSKVVLRKVGTGDSLRRDILLCQLQQFAFCTERCSHSSAWSPTVYIHKIHQTNQQKQTQLQPWPRMLLIWEMRAIRHPQN